jgi:replication factor A1
LNGYISRINNDEKIYYPACQSDNCRRKVIEDSTGYKCEHCGKTFISFQPTYMISARISDFTESIYVNFAREHGAALMGMKAEEFKEFKENHSEQEVQNFFDSLLLKPFNIMVKGKYEMFNNEYRMRYFAVKVFPHNVQAENKALLKRLEMYSNL